MGLDEVCRKGEKKGGSVTQLKGWVGVDLDGTLAVYDGWQGIEHIGEPIQPVVNHVKMLLAAGVDVRIFTARVQEGLRAIVAIQDWCLEYIGTVLPVTDKKDFSMVYALDDRIITVEMNTGKLLAIPPALNAIKDHWDTSKGAPDPVEFKHE